MGRDRLATVRIIEIEGDQDVEVLDWEKGRSIARI